MKQQIEIALLKAQRKVNDWQVRIYVGMQKTAFFFPIFAFSQALKDDELLLISAHLLNYVKHAK